MSSILLLLLLLFSFLFNIIPKCHPTSPPLNCSDTTRICTSFLALKSSPNLTLPLLQSMFDISPEDITSDEATNPNFLFIRKNCSCLYERKYLANTTFTMRGREGLVNAAVARAYGGLALDFGSAARRARVGAVISLRLYCGCSSGLWNYLMSYVMEEGDSIEVVSRRFGVGMGDVERVNGGGDGVVGGVFYIPLNSGLLL